MLYLKLDPIIERQEDLCLLHRNIHSYSNDLIWEPEWPNDESKPWIIGSRQYGRISIANSDAAASADTNAAITEGIRAANEMLSF